MSSARFTSVLQVIETYPGLRTELTTKPPDGEPLVGLKHLADGPTPEDAIMFCAYLLDRRRVVWWAAQCARKLGSPVDHDEDVALKLAEAWVRDPEEHRRVSALNTGLNGNHDLPGTWVSLSAGASGGTMRSGNNPGPPVPPELCASSAATAILIALATQPVRDRRGHIASCVQVGQELFLRE